jgi:hypothetical protein
MKIHFPMVYKNVIFPFATKWQVVKVIFFHILFFNIHKAYFQVMCDKPAPVSNMYQDCIKILEDIDFTPKPLSGTDKKLKAIQQQNEDNNND